jgi:hypothetical protein
MGKLRHRILAARKADSWRRSSRPTNPERNRIAHGALSDSTLVSQRIIPITHRAIFFLRRIIPTIPSALN